MSRNVIRYALTDRRELVTPSAAIAALVPLSGSALATTRLSQPAKRRPRTDKTFETAALLRDLWIGHIFWIRAVSIATIEKRDAAQVPAGPVYGFDQLMDDPHIKARKMVVDIEHPKIGPMKMLGLPIKSTGDLAAIRAPAPWLGQHSQEVLSGAGYSASEIAKLFQDGVVFDRCRDDAPPLN